MISQSLLTKFIKHHSCPNTLLWMKHLKYSAEKINNYSTNFKEKEDGLKEDLAKEHVKNFLKRQQTQKEAKAFRKDFIVSVLNSSATKREAKSYIQRFASPDAMHMLNSSTKKKSPGIFDCNFEGIYKPAAIQDSPKFIQKPVNSIKGVKETHRHLAIVKVRAIQNLSDETISGIGRTILQLSRLGLTSIVVLDFNCEDRPLPDFVRRDAKWKKLEEEQSSRIINAINQSEENVARLVENIVGVHENHSIPGLTKEMRTFIAFPDLLATHLRRGIVPVIAPVGYTSLSHNSLTVPANEIVIALTRQLVGAPNIMQPEKNNDQPLRDHQYTLRLENSLDRLILLDPLGGIPTPDLPHGYHVYLNMIEEYEQVRKSLLQNHHKYNPATSEPKFYKTSLSPSSSQICLETPLKNPKPSEEKKNTKLNYDNLYHLQNLELTRSVLSMLPSSSSALLIGPEEIANSTRDNSYQPDLVGTRRQVNPLIHNLLTDKSVFSSSLPSGRRRKQASLNEYNSSLDYKTMPITFAKQGIPITIFPDPKIAPWIPPQAGSSKVSLTNSEIDLPLLVNLINDSFGRTLDLPAYLARVESRIAGVIIAGDYEGGAVLTWETPPGVDPSDTTCMVPYLDKFAVLRRSQGSGGVADLIFNCMVRKCLPRGVVWRSRQNNPVNKWYFERSRGSWNLSSTNWTMFWTTPNLKFKQRFLLQDYEEICRSIQPTWLDI